MKRAQKVKLSLFREDPDNVSVATDEEIRRLAGKLKRVPLGLTAMRIAYVTDAPGGGRMVISGNKRLRCLKAAYGEDGEVPAEWFQDITAMSEAERHEFRINANISDGSFDAEKLLAQYDRDELAALMSADALQEILDAAETDEAKDGKTDADAVPEAPATPVSKRGEVYQCGEHRLMCGDATSAEDVARLMAGEKADLLLTDPPYGIDYGGMLKGKGDGRGGSDKNGWKDHGAPEWDKERPKKQTFDAMFDFSKNQIIWGGNYFADLLPARMCWLVWDKGQRDFSLADGELAWTSFQKALRIKSISRAVANREKKVHATQKPVELFSWCIEEVAARNAEIRLVLDLFLGSGTTAIACEKTGRVCYGMELDPRYCDVIRKRWAEFVHGEGCDWQALTPCAADLPRKEGK